MNIIGLIVEYNPLHNGHIYQLKKIDELFENNLKIAVMSGDFVQRGEPAILNKMDRTKQALLAGVDLVVELPIFYSTCSAEFFARGAINILNSLFCDTIVFGSETADIKFLKNIINISKSDDFKNNLQFFLKNGYSYVNSYIQALNLDEAPKSNDLLALEYLKAIDDINPNTNVVAIKRQSAGYYDENNSIDNKTITSATDIRKKLKNNENIKNFIPDEFISFYKNKKFTFLEDFYKLIRISILNSKNLSLIADLEDGLHNKLFKNAMKYEDFYLFFKNSISKRLTVGRLQRILIHILLDLTKDDILYTKNNLPFINILGMSERGQKYLNSLKRKDLKVKILTARKNINKLLNEEELYFYEKNLLASIKYKMISSYDEEKFVIRQEKGDNIL